MATKKKTEFYPGIYWGLIIAVLSILLLLSIVQGYDTVKEDVVTITESGLSFRDIISLRFEPVKNIIGPFGVLSGNLLNKYLGSFFSYILLLSTLSIGIFKAVRPQNKEILMKFYFFITAGFFFNFFLLASGVKVSSGIIISRLSSLSHSIFNDIGTAIITFSLTLLCLIVIIGTSAFIKMINALGLMLKNLYLTISKYIFEASKTDLSAKPEKKTKPSIVDKKGEEVLQIEEDTPKPPTIIKHNSPVKTSEDDFYPYEDNDYEFDSTSNNNIYSKKDDRPVRKSFERNNELVNDTYVLPEIDTLLQEVPKQTQKDHDSMEEEINSISSIITDKLQRLGIKADVVNANVGPVITQYELKPSPETKVSSFLGAANDLALAIKANSIRVQAPIPGKGLIGIEVPNKQQEIIYLKEVLLSKEMKNFSGKLAIAIGKDVTGNPVVADLTKMPHLLIAGATGSGKSVCINSIICSLLLRHSPDELRLMLLDPKRIELSNYEGVPHLIRNVITDHEDALVALQWAISEMEKRLETLQRYEVRDISSYNKKAATLNKNAPNAEDDTINTETVPHLPYIVIVIDEFADLILSAGRDIEVPIIRLAQMARATGIHLLLATQRPSQKIITGLIRANFPAKIAFRVARKVDSRVILETNGAESLLGFGDMLFSTPASQSLDRIHGAFISDIDIENVIDYLRLQPAPVQDIDYLEESSGEVDLVKYDDEFFIEAAKLIIATNSASVSMLQRHFKIGYARAGRLIDLLEEAKIVGKYAGSKSRDVIATKEILNAYNIEV